MLVAGLGVAVVVDLRTRRIPNELTAAMTGLGIGLAAGGVAGMSTAAALAGFALGLLVMLPGYAMGATGAGDVKLMGAVGALVGPAPVLLAFLCTSIAGGVLAIVVAVRRQRLAQTVAATGRLLATPNRAADEIRSAPRDSRFAYGPAIAAGSLIALWIG